MSDSEWEQEATHHYLEVQGRYSQVIAVVIHHL